jgi:hypothetical protein
MSIEEFRRLDAGAPPPGMPGALVALLRDSRGDWAGAHEAAQGDATPAGAWVHAYLHRKEGDLGNAAYWYRRAGRRVPKCGEDAEWAQIAGELLNAGGA